MKEKWNNNINNINVKWIIMKMIMKCNNNERNNNEIIIM